MTKAIYKKLNDYKLPYRKYILDFAINQPNYTNLNSYLSFLINGGPF